MKKRVPRIYYPIIGVLKYIKRLREPYQIYITDSLGGDFKSYLNNPSNKDKKRVLISGLDSDSVNTVEVITERMLHYPNENNKEKMDKSAPIIGGLLPVEKEEEIQKNHFRLKQQEAKITLSGKHLGESVFCYFHGLTSLSEYSISQIAKGDIIDAGAYIGDSAIAFLKNFEFQKVWSIEMSKISIDAYKNNMQANKISEDKYTIIQAGLCSEKKSAPITLKDTGSAGFSLARSINADNEISVPLTPLDELVETHKMNPSLIKADIEGFGLDMLKGATQTIKKFKPVISLAVYHNPYEFFEAKPFIEELCPEYRFKIVKLCSGIRKNLIHSEVILLAYIPELEQ